MGLGRDNEPANGGTAVRDEPPAPDTIDRPVAGAYREPTDAGNAPGITDLIKNLRDESLHLIRQEVNLAKTEIGEKASFFAVQTGKIAVGGAVLLVAGLGLLSAVAFLIAGLIDLLIDINDPLAIGIGFLITGVVVALIGYLLLNSAKSKIAGEPLKPERTIQSLQNDKEWAKSRTLGKPTTTPAPH